MYKIHHGISPTIFKEIFTLRHQNQYNLWNWIYFDIPRVRTVYHGSESVRYLGHKIWKIIPTLIKELDTIDKFKVAIKNRNQNFVHAGYAKSTNYRLHKDLNINLLHCLHIQYKIVDTGLLQTCKMEMFCDCS